MTTKGREIGTFQQTDEMQSPKWKRFCKENQEIILTEIEAKI